MFKLVASLALGATAAAAQEMTLVQYVGSKQCLDTATAKVCQSVTLGTCVRHNQKDGTAVYTKVSKDESNGSYTVESCKEAGCKCAYPHKGFNLDECNVEYSGLKLVEGKQKGCSGDTYDNDVAWAGWDGKLAAAVPAEKSSDEKKTEKSESLIQLKVATPVQHAMAAAEDKLAEGVESLTGEIEKLDAKFLEPKGHSKWVLPEQDGTMQLVLADRLEAVEDAVNADKEPVKIDESLEYKSGEASVGDWRDEYTPMHAENYSGKTVHHGFTLAMFTWMAMFCIAFAAVGAYVYSKSAGVP